DLGASVAFVHLAAESDQMQRRPRSPRARLLDRRMLGGILGGGLTLALLVGLVYAYGLDFLTVDGARTLALVCWLLGHATLGVAMGWERRPISLSALAHNPAMIAWAAAATAF